MDTTNTAHQRKTNQSEGTKRIFILGNGFDLAHHLPTAYIHFMEAMQEIQLSCKAIGFDDIFSKRLNKDDPVFNKTKELYKTDDVQLTKDDVEDFKKRLITNKWFNYFQSHLSGDIVTWIDFESEIKFVLDKINDVFNENSPYVIDDFGGFLNEKFKKNDILYLAIFVSLKIFYLESSNYYFNKNYIKHHGKNKLGLDSEAIISTLIKDLDDFNQIFADYLCKVVDKLEPKKPFTPFAELQNVDKVYTFNYTKTFQQFYSYESQDVQHLHGVLDKKIVLGVDRISEQSQNLNAFGFVKAHQKIRHNTDYVFDIDKNLKSSGKKTIGFDSEKGILISGEYTYEIIIFGHSLDISDKEYIQAIFNVFQGGTITHISIKVFFYKDSGDILNNLMKTMGQDIVSDFCKKGYLVFEEIPEIAPAEE